MGVPFLKLEDSGDVVELAADVTTVGRGEGVDISLDDPTVSRLHAELVRRGPYVYVEDLGLSSNGTRVNGRPVGRRTLHTGDVVSFGTARARVGGVVESAESSAAVDTMELRRITAPDLTRRELEVLTALCRPALRQDAFVAPASAREIADELVVTEAAVKQHLLRLYQKFRIPEGTNRRAKLANEVIAAGVVRPLPDAPADPGSPASAPGGLSIGSESPPVTRAAAPAARSASPAPRASTPLARASAPAPDVRRIS
ncbi:MAG TPA: FHA domain-containing protein [Mycobacteriales bacterium]|nr:FHA domain-containing protein [Mycobacteriales bacterium]